MNRSVRQSVGRSVGWLAIIKPRSKVYVPSPPFESLFNDPPSPAQDPFIISSPCGWGAEVATLQLPLSVGQCVYRPVFLSIQLLGQSVCWSVFLSASLYLFSGKVICDSVFQCIFLGVSLSSTSLSLLPVYMYQSICILICQFVFE